MPDNPPALLELVHFLLSDPATLEDPSFPTLLGESRGHLIIRKTTQCFEDLYAPNLYLFVADMLCSK
jgi:hypothetical protein